MGAANDAVFWVAVSDEVTDDGRAYHAPVAGDVDFREITHDASA